jgi:hypothetical protein
MTNAEYQIGHNNDNDIFYIHYPTEYIWSLEKLKELSKYKLIVVNSCSEHWGDGGGSEAVIHCQRANLNFLVLTHNPSEHLLHSRIMYYPYWYHYSKKHFKKSTLSDTKKYKLSCLNGNPRPHRIANYFLLRSKSYIDQICITIFNVPEDKTPIRDDDVLLNDLEIAQWNHLKNQLPMRHIPSATDLDLPALTDSYIHLVTETTVIPNIFITEKTWKPIAAGMLFLVFGNPGTVDHLRSLGVDVFDDIIDHKYYDNQLDWRLRLERIHVLIDNLVQHDLEHIYKITKDRRLENQRKFFAGEFDTHYNQEIALQIEKLKNVSIR